MQRYVGKANGAPKESNRRTGFCPAVCGTPETIPFFREAFGGWPLLIQGGALGEFKNKKKQKTKTYVYYVMVEIFVLC